MSASNNTPKQKKVRYEAGTKGSSSSHNHHRSSRDQDSGVGSSSASDRASLGTTPNAYPSSSQHPFSSQQIETQRHNLRAVQEALDTANERIQQYEASMAKLNAALSESNKENRLLKREKSELFNQIRDLQDDLEDERRRGERIVRRESTASSHSASASRNSPPLRSSPRNSREIEAAAAASFARESARRASYQAQQAQAMYPPAAPQPPLNSTPNPFLPSPRNSSTGVPSSAVAFAPERVVVGAYSHAPPSPSAVSYSTPSGSGYVLAHGHAHGSMPVRSRYEGSSRGSSSGSVVNDGKYHLSPL
ncbi:hypothetical protein IFR05_010766 [Cadophora sp. M221]|nr:hypothetical protein IFR05_010766 [Cadophora sp. M221]